MGRYFQSLFRLDGNCWRSSLPIAIAVCPFIIHTNSLVITPLTWLSSGFFRKSIESEQRRRRRTATAIMAQWWARQKRVQFLCNTCVIFGIIHTFACHYRSVQTIDLWKHETFFFFEDVSVNKVCLMLPNNCQRAWKNKSISISKFHIQRMFSK